MASSAQGLATVDPSLALSSPPAPTSVTSLADCHVESNSVLPRSVQGKSKTYYLLLRSPCDNHPHRIMIDVTDDISEGMSAREREDFLSRLYTCAYMWCPRSVKITEKDEEKWYYVCDTHKCLDKRSADEHVRCFEPVLTKPAGSKTYQCHHKRDTDPYWTIKLIMPEHQPHQGNQSPIKYVRRTRDTLEDPSGLGTVGLERFTEARWWLKHTVDFSELRNELQNLPIVMAGIQRACDLSDKESFKSTFKTAWKRFHGDKAASEWPGELSEKESRPTWIAMDHLVKVAELCEDSQGYTGGGQMLESLNRLANASDHASISQSFRELRRVPRPPPFGIQFVQRERRFISPDAVEKDLVWKLTESRTELDKTVGLLESSASQGSADVGQNNTQCCSQQTHGSKKHSELCKCKSLIAAIDQARLILPTLTLLYMSRETIADLSMYQEGPPDPDFIPVLNSVADILNDPDMPGTRKLSRDAAE